MNEDEDKQPGTSETGSKFSVEKMCKYLGVSRSGYYDWLKRKPSKRKTENAEILRVAQKSYEESKRIYGLDKLLAAVRISFLSVAAIAYTIFRKKISFTHGERENLRQQPTQIISSQLQRTYWIRISLQKNRIPYGLQTLPMCRPIKAGSTQPQ